MRKAKIGTSPESDIKIEPFEMWVPDEMNKDDLINQVREIYAYEVYKPIKAMNDIVVDLGANVGMATLYLRKYAKKIYSLEPNPEFYESLVRNTNFDNVVHLNYGILDKGGVFTFFSPEDGIPQTLFPVTDKPITKNLNVQMKTIDQFMEENNIDHIDCLKIDTEGSEYPIFLGESFSKVVNKIDCIVGEGHFTPGGQIFPQMIEFILKDYGFKYRISKTPKPNLNQSIIYHNGDYTKKVTGNFWTNFIAWR